MCIHFCLNSFIFSHFSMTKYLSPERALSVRVSVCVSVCLSGSLVATIVCRFLWNFDHMIIAKIWDDTFLRFWKCCYNDIITAFLCFSWGHSHAFYYCAIFLKLTHFNLKLNALYGIANKRFRLISSNQYGQRKKTPENPLKQKCVQIQKQSVYSYWFEVADDECGYN